MKILLWIQGWTGRLNSWAWTEWSRLHRKDQKLDYHAHLYPVLGYVGISSEGSNTTFYAGENEDIAIPIPKIPKAKNPGTIFNTVAPQDDALYNAPFVAAAVFTSVEIGPIKDTPTSTATKPPIKFAIIF